MRSISGHVVHVASIRPPATCTGDAALRRRTPRRSALLCVGPSRRWQPGGGRGGRPSTATPRRGEQRAGWSVFSTAVDYLRAQGFSDLSLWMLKGNERAGRFYQPRRLVAGRRRAGDRDCRRVVRRSPLPARTVVAVTEPHEFAELYDEQTLARFEVADRRRVPAARSLVAGAAASAPESSRRAR